VIDLSDFDLGDFDIDIKIDMTQEDARYCKPPMDRGCKVARYEYAEEMADSLDLDARTMAIVSGNFEYGDLIEAILRRKQLRAHTVTISTLSIGRNNIDSLSNLLKYGYIANLNLIVSAYWYSHERHGGVPYIYKHCDIDNRFQLAVAGTHCKVVTMHLEDDRKIVMHGSANLRTSGCLEQVMVESSPELYDFFDSVHLPIIEQYATIKKEIRRAKLWDIVKQTPENPVKEKANTQATPKPQRQNAATK